MLHASLVGGELANGARAAASFSQSGSELSIGISVLKGPTGTLAEIEKGAVNAGKATGAESVKITAAMAKDSMARLLRRNGFSQDSATGNWIKIIKLMKEPAIAQ